MISPPSSSPSSPLGPVARDFERVDRADLTRRERRKQEVRDRILEASMKLFEQRGIEATKVVEICERADVAHKTFFNHFQSKRELLREIARFGLDQLLADIAEAHRQPLSSSGRIHYFFERIASNAAAAGPMHRELLTEIVRVAHEQGTEPEQARKLQAAFGAIVRTGLAAGDLRSRHSAETLTEMLMGAFYVLMFNWANLPDYPLQARAAETARFLSDAMTDESGQLPPMQPDRESHEEGAR
jgi:AcrR family transcriptional regulator